MPTPPQGEGEQKSGEPEVLIEEDTLVAPNNGGLTEPHPALAFIESRDQSTKASNESTSVVTLEGSTLYANGVSIVVKKGADSKIYIFDETGTQKLLDQALPSVPTIYGGSKNQDVQGDISIVVENLKVNTLYGGGYSDGTASANVSGNVSVLITGRCDAGGKIYGGGYAVSTKGNASANVSGSISVRIPATPTGNHGNIYGGGYATSNSGYSASATAGFVSVAVSGKTYNVNGGGYASVSGSNTGSAATADVSGQVAVSLEEIDVRDVYCGGYATGSRAQANTGAVSFLVTGGEVSSLVGGGKASSLGVARVAGDISGSFVDVFNIYSYVYAGGSASGGADATVEGSTSLLLQNSDVPIYEQRPGLEPVAGMLCAGGDAGGVGSRADVLGDTSFEVNGGTNAGRLLGGGDVADGGSATVGSVSMHFADIGGSVFAGDGQTYTAVVVAGGETDGGKGSNTSIKESQISISRSSFDRVWGGGILENEPVAYAAFSHLELDAGSSLRSIASFDTVAIDSPLSVVSATSKSALDPTRIVLLDTFSPKPALEAEVFSCDEIDPEASTFLLAKGELVRTIEDSRMIWRIAQPKTGGIEIISPDPEDTAPAVTLENPQDISSALLTPEDKEAIKQGASIGFSFSAKSADVVDPIVEETLKQTIKGNNLNVAAQYEILLFKQMNGFAVSMRELQQPIPLAIEIPEALRASVSSDAVREFSLVRVHQGTDGNYAVDILPSVSSIDPDTFSVTFMTDRFSVYVLAFKDVVPTLPDPPDLVDPIDPIDPIDPLDPKEPNTPSDNNVGDGSGLQGQAGNEVTHPMPKTTGREATLSHVGDTLASRAAQITVIAACFVAAIISVVAGVCRIRKSHS